MRKWRCIGVMSGTSIDGIDVAYCSFWIKDNNWKYEIINAQTYKYSENWKQKLYTAHKLNAHDFLILHKNYGIYIGNIVNKFIEKHEIEKVDFIASHGHTIFHEPGNKLNFQLGNGTFISVTTEIPTICDFRTLDIALGGQGAPLVPIGDHFLFPEYDYCLNIGGFSNVSFSKSGQRIAFDICPANYLLNLYATKLNYSYDKNGNIAKSGKVIKKLLNELNNLPYYKKKYPKSLSRENIEREYIPIIKKYRSNIRDILATLTEHISDQIAKNIKDGKTLVTGGGAYNKYLIEKIKAKTKSEIIIPSKLLIKYKEALIFAFLGVLRMLEINNCLKSVTGAKYDCCSGLIHIFKPRIFINVPTN